MRATGILWNSNYSNTDKFFDGTHPDHPPPSLLPSRTATKGLCPIPVHLLQFLHRRPKSRTKGKLKMDGGEVSASVHAYGPNTGCHCTHVSLVALHNPASTIVTCVLSASCTASRTRSLITLRSIVSIITLHVVCWSRHLLHLSPIITKQRAEETR